MTSTISYHPSADHLREFNQGRLSSGLSVAISAHLDLCADCQALARTAVDQQACEWSAASVPVDLDRFGDFLDRIMNEPQQDLAPQSAQPRTACHLQEFSVELPRVLARAASQGLMWRKLAGGINQARLAIDDETQCDFMYMKAGSQAPRHRHHGLEVTLVLEGTFQDELGRYVPGDFILRRGDQTHTPASDDGCLCLTVLDSPLHFTSGLARMLNPFQRLLFNR